MEHGNVRRGGMIPHWPASPRPVWLGGGPDDDELVNFIDDDANEVASGRAPPCIVLVVDDDQDVHSGTRIALEGERVFGRELKLLHAYSAEQARQMITSNAAIALVLLDVVMETNDAGLRLVSEIRNDIKNSEVRIIVRTGQPGYETDARISDNKAINGYLTKARLTRAMLLDSIATALASGRKTDAS